MQDAAWLDGRLVESIGAEAVNRLRWKSDQAACAENTGGVPDCFPGNGGFGALWIDNQPKGVHGPILASPGASRQRALP